MSTETFILATLALLSQACILGTALFGFISAHHRQTALHVMINSRLDELIASARTLAFSEGLSAGKSREQTAQRGREEEDKTK